MQGITRFACQTRLPQTLNAFSGGAKRIYCKRKASFLEALNAFTTNAKRVYPERVCLMHSKVGVTTHAQYWPGRCDVTVGVAWACIIIGCSVNIQLYCGVDVGWPRPSN